jgi:hypothetical protein
MCFLNTPCNTGSYGLTQPNIHIKCFLLFNVYTFILVDHMLVPPRFVCLANDQTCNNIQDMNNALYSLSPLSVQIENDIHQ